jgi:hypothetical protein
LHIREHPQIGTRIKKVLGILIGQPLNYFKPMFHIPAASANIISLRYSTSPRILRLKITLYNFLDESIAYRFDSIAGAAAILVPKGANVGRTCHQENKPRQGSNVF